MVNRIEVSGSPPIHPMGAFIVSAREPDAAVSWHRVAESRHFVEEDNEWRKSDAGRKKKKDSRQDPCLILCPRLINGWLVVARAGNQHPASSQKPP